RLSPPFPEVHYNRGDLRAEMGDVDGAIADFSRVLDLDPDNVDAYVNRAGLRCDLGENEAAWADVDAGLELDPEHAHLQCLRGRRLADAERLPEAIEALTRAVRADEGLAEAWAWRGAVAHQLGHAEAALADLDRAVAVADTPAYRFNRAAVRQQSGRYA